MKRRFGPKHAPVLRAFAKAYRVQAEVETDPEEMRALIRLAKKTERKAKELEKVGPTRQNLRGAENDPALNDRLRGEAAAADTMLHIVLEYIGGDFVGRDVIASDLIFARDHAKVSPEGTLPSEVARKGYADKLQELLSRILDR